MPFFYYTILEIFSANDNRLAFGFSKDDLPNNLSTDWCHYTVSFGPTVPDFPKLGDSEHFVIIGVNTYFPNLIIFPGPFAGPAAFAGSDLIAISKPPAAGLTTCPLASSFKFGAAFNLVDSTAEHKQVFTPVPANQIYGAPGPSHPPAGFVVARNGSLPSDKLWFFDVTKGPNGKPVFGGPRAACPDAPAVCPVASYNMPPVAVQPGESPNLDTMDARMTQAVQAFNPRNNTHSFWTQHTILSRVDPAFSAVQFYESNSVGMKSLILGGASYSTPQSRQTARHLV